MKVDRGYGKEGVCHVDGSGVEGSGEFLAGFVLGSLECFDQSDL